MSGFVDRRAERLFALTAELKRRQSKERHAAPGGLMHFVRDFWPVIEPGRTMVEGWVLEAICEHLEAVTHGQIRRLLINVPPGCSKSLICNVFWPAWVWAVHKPSYRFMAASYSQSLTLRDNVRFRNVVSCKEYATLYGDKFGPSKDVFNLTKVTNDKTGWKLATSVGGVGTGERGDVFLCDDPNSVKEAESEAIRASTNQWFLEVVPTRLNDDAGAIVVIQQRTNEDDISGTILSRQLGYEHLCIPMEFDPARHCTTSIGWSDPREEDGELAWPDRFSARTVDELKRTMGPYASSGQLQQSPEVRGGGIFRREWWQLWDEPGGKFPICEFIIASLDPAYTSKQENDPSGFTVWGVFTDKLGNPKLILMDAWRKRLDLHSSHVERLPGETNADYLPRAQKSWGLVEWVAHSCKRFRVDRLIIEGKATGLSVAQELRTLYSGEGWSVEIVNPGNQDKVARAYSVQPMFSDGMIYAPDRKWADMVIDEASKFPKGATDDLVDSVTQCLRWLRTNNMAQRREERAHADRELAMTRRKLEPLYDV